MIKPCDSECLVEFSADMPVAGAQDLLVRVMAVAVNPMDTKLRKLLGETRQDPPRDPPRVLGFDAAMENGSAHGQWVLAGW